MKFIIYTPPLDIKIGGTVVLHKLAKDLNDSNLQAMLFVTDGSIYQNIFCDQFAKLKDIDDNAIVIYPEIVEGNPLKAKSVVRWLLCGLGIHTPLEIYKTWNPKDLVFHYSTFNDKLDPEQIELLYTAWIDTKVENKKGHRSGSCYLFKKAHSFHKNLKMIHPKDALMIDNCSFEEIIAIFNEKEFFYCYDPYSFYDIIAALCGCIPIIYPLEKVSKLQWLKSRAAFQMYLETSDDVAGIAYGIEDIPHAKNTLQNAEEEQKRSVELGKKTVIDFAEKCRITFFLKEDHSISNTVESLSKHFKINQLDDNKIDKLIYDQQQKMDQLQFTLEEKTHALESKNREVEQKNHEIRSLAQILQEKETLIHFMSTSKFWKFRNFVKKFI